MRNVEQFTPKNSHFKIISLLVITLLVLSTLEDTGLALADPPDPLATATTSFNNLWSRNDQPVATGQAIRSWTWGTKPFYTTLENYKEASGGKRAVTYFDKSRMEINNPSGDSKSQWYITNGLLVKEMVSGQVQDGDNLYHAAAPASVPVAGDPLDINQSAPTYASFSQIASLRNDRKVASAMGTTITATIDKSGRVKTDASLSQYAIKNSYYDSTLGHNIPNIFMAFFNSKGTTYQNGAYTTDNLFDWVFTAGLPITEPYWTTTKVSGKNAVVLVQLFERRVLTFNPANPIGWQVEMGNVGQHYYTWRYQPSTSSPAPNPTPTPTPVPVAQPATSTTFVKFSDGANGEKVLEIGNDALKRTMVYGKAGGAYTSSLLNRLTNQEYIDEPGAEFRVSLSRELAGEPDTTAEINSDQLKAVNFKVVTQTATESVARVTFTGNFQGNPLTVSVNYQSLAGQNFVRKWLTIDPFNAAGWVIKAVRLEEWKPSAAINPIVPTPRFQDSFRNGEPNYNLSVDNKNIDTTNTTQRYQSAEESYAIGAHNNGQEGFYFFAHSLFGEESFNKSNGLNVGNTDFVEPSNPFSSGMSVIGVWQGNPALGFKNYNNYIYDFYATVKGKPDPVWYSTWYPFESGIYEKLLLDTVDKMQSAGFYDLLHIDAGWQSGAPLQVDTDRFPNGLDPIVNKLKSYNKGVGLWMNPFSRSYQSLENYDDFANQHPDWVDQNDPNKRFCPLSGAGTYVYNRLLEIARNWPLDVIYWDGADWNISNCQSSDRNWRTPDEEYHNMLKFYASLMQDLHAIRPNLRMVVWSAPGNIHWLNVVDQVQLSDVGNQPLLQSELYRRQQLYFSSFEMPYGGVWGDWYGLGYHRSWAEGIGQPLPLLKYALVSTVGNGATQAGGSIDLSITPPYLIDFMNQLFSWRKQFANYFTVYQHVLGFPDGKNVDGEAHIINGKGFILLFNPSTTAKQINIPLNEPELELKPGLYYNLSNWSNLSSGIAIGQYRPGDSVSVTVQGQSYQIIGINIG